MFVNVGCKKIKFFNKDSLNNLDIKNALKKKRMCQAIAKFYIKIAHVFATIVRTVNPVYVYKDNQGNTVRANLYEKHTIPANAPRKIYKMNIFQRSLKGLNWRSIKDLKKILGRNQLKIFWRKFA